MVCEHQLIVNEAEMCHRLNSGPVELEWSAMGHAFAQQNWGQNTFDIIK